MNADSTRQRLLDDLRGRLSGTLIVLDFDGTLAPLVPDPSTSAPAGGAVAALDALAALGARVVISTGRSAQTAVDLAGVQAVAGLSVHGLYGAERWSQGRLDSRPDNARVGAARRELPAALAAVPGTDDVWIEDKRLSLVVHTRRSTDPDRLVEQLRPGVTAVAAAAGLELHDGHFVLELRLPGFDKGGVLNGLIEQAYPAALLVAGDDVGDLPAFQTVAGLRAEGMTAWTVLIGPGNDDLVAAADLRLAAPADLVGLLTDLAAATGPIDAPEADTAGTVAGDAVSAQTSSAQPSR